MKIIQKLSQASKFSDSEKIVANYILNHRKEVLDLSIQQLAGLTYTSNPTIIRLCRKCGTKGYKDFKIKLAIELEHLTNDLNIVDVNFPFKKADECKKIAKSLGNLYQESIRRTYALINENEFEEASKMISNANIIYLFGYGDCMIQAMNFKNKLIKINKHAIIAMENQQQVFHCYNATENDCVIFITYRGNKALLPMAKYIAKKKTPIICITANTDSTISKYAHINLKLAKNEDEKTKIASFSSQIEIDYILNILYACVFELSYDQNYQYKNEDFGPMYEDELMKRID